MHTAACAVPSGTVSIEIVRIDEDRVSESVLADDESSGSSESPGAAELLKQAFSLHDQSRRMLLWKLRNIPNLWRGFWRVAAARMLNVPHFYGVVRLAVQRANGSQEDYGVVSLRVVTNAGVKYIVDAFLNNATLPNMKYHGFGSNKDAESVSQTALGFEQSAYYGLLPNRPTGTNTAPSNNVYRSVAIFTPASLSGSITLGEYGLFSVESATTGGVLFDRSTFADIVLSDGDSIQVTYECTFNAGG